jgi:hypothetical protein
MLRTFYSSLLLIAGFLASPVYSHGQTSQSSKNSQAQASDDVVVFSGVATTARIADPNERVVFNGRVMRMADFVAAVSSSTEAARRLHNQEKHSHETDQPAPPSQP